MADNGGGSAYVHSCLMFKSMHYVIMQDIKVIIIVTISKVQSNQKVTQPQCPLTYFSLRKI